ncbi:MAG: phosphoribosylformylglycinamidine synthase subunit PurQ [Thermoplasmataceae archaeon]
MSDIKIAILRMEGTNNEAEVYRAFASLGAIPEYIHIKQLENKEASLEEFQGIFIPGGFSAGDYVRAGVIFGKRLMKSSSVELRAFIEEKKPVIGTCNGFQILSEMGLLPDVDGNANRSMVLSVNKSGKFECRTTYIRFTNKNPVLGKVMERGMIIQAPVAHKEGQIKFIDGKTLDDILQNDQVIFKYTNADGTSDSYPWNPNGSVHSIAGLSNPQGNVIGLMPHPERSFDSFNMSGREREGNLSSGRIFYGSIIKYIQDKSI